MSTAAARRRWRRYVHRKRDRKLALARRSRTHCPRRFGPHECGGLIETIVHRDGATSLRCAWCERCQAGICRDCPEPVAGRVGSAIRCARCRHTKRVNERRQYRRDNHEKELARAARYRASHREQLRAYGRARMRRLRNAVTVAT